MPSCEPGEPRVGYDVPNRGASAVECVTRVEEKERLRERLKGVRDLKGGMRIELPIKAWACGKRATHAKESWTDPRRILARKAKAEQTTIFDMPGVETRLDPMRDA
jgi:hypothetical protein